jgi:hypothetical protein
MEEVQMDRKQFKRLQTAVQYASDDASLQRHKQPPTGWRWYQGAWGSGMVTKRRRKRKATGTFIAVACPTTGCVAGTIVMQAGDQLVAPAECEVGTSVTTDYCIDKTGTVHDIESRATQLLGVEEEELHGLFNGGLGIQSVIQISELIATEHGFKLELEKVS